MSRVFLALLGCVLLGTATAQDPARSPDRAQTDAELREHVEAALKADPLRYYKHVDVRAEGGVVYLSGYVWTVQEKHAAVKLAKKAGATRVVDSTRIESQLQKR